MEVNELRIGNWVEYPNNPHSTTQKHNYSTVNGITCFGFSHKVCVKRKFNQEYYFPAEKIKPILLTPEWLERCGCYLKDKFDKSIHVKLPNSAIYGYYFRGSGFRTTGWNAQNIDYVHQLQNLYFSLTGQELQIKEPVNA